MKQVWCKGTAFKFQKKMYIAIISKLLLWWWWWAHTWTCSSHSVHIQFCLEGAQFEAQRELILSHCKSQTNLNLFQLEFTEKGKCGFQNQILCVLQNQNNIQKRSLIYCTSGNLKPIKIFFTSSPTELFRLFWITIFQTIYFNFKIKK